MPLQNGKLSKDKKRFLEHLRLPLERTNMTESTIITEALEQLAEIQADLDAIVESNNKILSQGEQQ